LKDRGLLTDTTFFQAHLHVMHWSLTVLKSARWISCTGIGWVPQESYPLYSSTEDSTAQEQTPLDQQNGSTVQEHASQQQQQDQLQPQRGQQELVGVQEQQEQAQQDQDGMQGNQEDRSCLDQSLCLITFVKRYSHE
jgi:hypothetical protein